MTDGHDEDELGEFPPSPAAAIKKPSKEEPLDPDKADAHMLAQDVQANSLRISALERRVDLIVGRLRAVQVWVVRLIKRGETPGGH